MNINPYLTTTEFYKTPPVKCPYLPNKKEELIFTYLKEDTAVNFYDTMTNIGFRRSHNIVYRPDCKNCSECIPVRIRVNDYKPNNSQQRVYQRNSNLVYKILPPVATDEHFNLFKQYQKFRHNEGNMSLMEMDEYRSMIEDTPIETKLIEYRYKNGDLFAVALTDQIESGLSMVYSFYRPDALKRSPGTWIILNHIFLAKKSSLPYVYLGFFINDCSKMSYKKNFKPLEALDGYIWKEM
tara:strand:+ start:142 stop:858 length:717 start_codon:yes stop_codon:yes gene_type:complete